MYQYVTMSQFKERIFFFVFHKNVHFYLKWRYECLCTEQYITVWVGQILIGYNFRTFLLGAENVKN